MLILGRKPGESLVIGEEITVTVLSVEPGGNVTLGIDAPREMLILRRELQQAASFNRESADTSASAQMIGALELVLSHPNDNKQKEG